MLASEVMFSVEVPSWPVIANDASIRFETFEVGNDGTAPALTIITDGTGASPLDFITNDSVDLRIYQPDEVQSPHCCPVCEGRQTMPLKFYEDDAPDVLDPDVLDPDYYYDAEEVPCRSCDGTGVLWR